MEKALGQHGWGLSLKTRSHSAGVEGLECGDTHIKSSKEQKKLAPHYETIPKSIEIKKGRPPFFLLSIVFIKLHPVKHNSHTPSCTSLYVL